MSVLRELPVALARRMALHAQGLALPPPRARATTADVHAVARRIGALQLDPISTVARSPLLVLHARLGAFDDALLDRAAYRDRRLLDYWAHDASLVPVEDLPLHRWQMRRHLWVDRKGRDLVRAWMAANAAFADAIATDLQARGPLQARDLEARGAAEDWPFGHWTDEVSARQTMARMLQLLWLTGRIGVADRRGTERRWDLLERCLPPGALAAADAEPLPDREVSRRATLRAVRMLGVAKAPHVRAHFTRNRYPDLQQTLDAHADAGVLERVAVAGTKGTWYGHAEDLEAAADLPPGWRTVALSPFDNLLCDRARTAELFGFEHRLEIYTPAPQRRWGYYVLPILHGERLVARADLLLDRAGGVLDVLALHHEPGRRAPGAVATALERLAAWRGARVGERSTL